MMMLESLGMQSGAVCSDNYMKDLQMFGLESIRMRDDATSTHDFRTMLIVWLFQFCLCFFVVIRSEIPWRDIFGEQLTPEYGVTRLITQIVMHILMQKEFEQGLNMMKYAANHPWKFRSVSLAFFTGFMQLVISFIIELANFYIVLANG